MFSDLRTVFLSKLAAGKIIILSMACWLVIGGLTDIVIDIFPVLFKFQQYFWTCALVGLGLGFFQKDKNHSPLLGKLLNHRNSTGLWLCTIAGTMAAVVSVHWPGGLATAISMRLQDASPIAFAPDFVKGDLFFDLTAITVFSFILFALIEIFLGPGRLLQDLRQKSGSITALNAFAGGSAAAWLINGLLSLFFTPPLVLLALGCFSFWLLDRSSKLSLPLMILALGSLSLTMEANSSQIKSAEKHSINQESFWRNGTRIDTCSIVYQDKILGFSVSMDHKLYQILEVPALGPAQIKELQNQSGLPPDALDYQQLPFRAMPPMAGKKALVLAAGVGSEVSQCLQQGVSQVTAVESQRWLARLAREKTFSPYENAAVTLETQDPRQFLRRTTEKYDLIIFTGLCPIKRPDPFAFINHDDYLYTTEAMKEAYDSLNPEGRIVIITPTDNGLLRLRLAANLIIVAKKLDLQLSTPYLNYLIVSKDATIGEGYHQQIEVLRTQLGSKTVTYGKGLEDKAISASPTSDNLPFLVDIGPFIPLEDSFFITVCLFVTAVAVRMHMQQEMLQNTTRERLRLFLLSSIFMLLMFKACMIEQFEYGNTPWTIYWTIASGWLALLAAGVASTTISIMTKGRWLVLGWSIFTFMALILDYGFNYSAAYFTSASSLRFLSTGLMPWLPAFGVGGWLVSTLAKSSDQQAAGLIFIGLALGSILALEALFNGLPSLDLVAATLAFAVSLLNLRTSAHKEQS